MIGVIEPCCFHRQLSEMAERAECGQQVVAVTWGDVALPQVLEFLVRRTAGAQVLLVLVRVRQQTLACLRRLMQERTPDGQWLVSSLTLISQGYEHNECLQQLGRFRSEGRVLLCEDKVASRLCTIMAPERSYVLAGALNQDSTYGLHMWQLSASQEMAERIDAFFNFQKKRKTI